MIEGLEQLLNQDERDRDVRVLNGGVPGYTLFQGVQYLLHRSEQFEPDMVLLYFGFNDYLGVSYTRTGSGVIRLPRAHTPT